MKVIELNSQAPSFSELLEAVQQEDVLLCRDGRPLARMERFDEEDWQDQQYESSAPALERGRHARAQYLRGEFKTLEQIKGESDRSENNQVQK
jgi:hypothetical protein